RAQAAEAEVAKIMRRLAYVIIPAVVFGCLFVWRFVQNRRLEAQQTRAARARRTAPPSVRVVRAEIRDIVHSFQGIGNIESPADVRIAPKVTGRLDFLQVREGDKAVKG